MAQYPKNIVTHCVGFIHVHMYVSLVVADKITLETVELFLLGNMERTVSAQKIFMLEKRKSLSVALLHHFMPHICGSISTQFRELTSFAMQKDLLIWAAHFSKRSTVVFSVKCSGVPLISVSI